MQTLTNSLFLIYILLIVNAYADSIGIIIRYLNTFWKILIFLLFHVFVYVIFAS
jgi:hypothetical protein